MAHGPAPASHTSLPTTTEPRSCGRGHTTRGAENMYDPDLYSPPVATLRTCHQLGALGQRKCLSLAAVEVSGLACVTGRKPRPGGVPPGGRRGECVSPPFQLPEAPPPAASQQWPVAWSSHGPPTPLLLPPLPRRRAPVTTRGPPGIQDQRPTSNASISSQLQSPLCSEKMHVHRFRGSACRLWGHCSADRRPAAGNALATEAVR